MSDSQRIFYFDALRALAILCVVMLHVTGHTAEIMQYNHITIFSVSGIYETFANNFFRMGVDLFLMLSGALLLGRDWKVKEFFLKRIPRIAVPFIFWSLIFSLILVTVAFIVPDADFVGQSGITGFLMLFADTLMFKAPGSVVYWFFWMILFVYIMMPLLNRWINTAELVDVEYILLIFLIFVSVVYPLNNQAMNLLADFIAPLALTVLGYYLRHNGRKIFNSVPVSVLLIIISSAVMLLYSYNTSILFVFHRYSLPVVILAVGFFCLFKSSKTVSNASGKITGIISSLSICSYGMYLIHSQMIMAVRKIFHLSSNFIFDYILLFIVGFILSWLIIFILTKIPIINELIGVK